MNAPTTEMSPKTTHALRMAGWSTAALLLIAPAIAMQFEGSGVEWTAGDFIVAGTVFAIVGGLFELTARASTNLAYRIGAVLAVGCACGQIWINLAVGIIGSEDNPANWTYFAVVLIAASGTIVALGHPRKLMHAMLAAAGAQIVFSIVHAIDGTPTPIIDGFCAALWIAAARLFARADREQQQVDAATS